MKNNFKLLLALLFTMLFGRIIIAQSTHTIDFEPSGVGGDWNWIVSENADNPPLEFIVNPVSGGINTSPTVAKFMTRQAGNPWALFFTDDDGQFTFDATNVLVKIMVYKPVISPIHFKVEGTSPALELVSTNTLINQWEEITFDFTTVIGNTYSRLVIIPDFLARAQDNNIYIDNIQVPNGVITIIPEPTVNAPTPTVPVSNVISVFSDLYPDISGTNFNPNWGQSTVVSFPIIQGDTTMKYSNLNYQGIELGSNQNLTAAGMLFLHLDFWNATSTNLGVSLISPGPVETRVALVPPGTTETWESVDIPLSDFAPVDLANVFQLKFDGNGTIYLDNIYFWNGIIPVELSSFSANVNGSNVNLAWSTATETNNNGFEVQRRSGEDFVSIGFVRGSGTTTEIQNYSFIDAKLSAGSYSYRLKQVDFDGSFEYSNVVNVNLTAPTVFSLEQNYPNPFNPSTVINYSIPQNSFVTLKVYDVIGNEVATLVNQTQSAGKYEVRFDASNLSNGVYMYSIKTDNFTSTKKMILMK